MFLCFSANTISQDEHHVPAHDESFTTIIQRLERNNQQARLEYKEHQEIAQKELRDAEQRELQWKLAAESYEVRLNEVKEKITPVLDTLTSICHSTLI